MLSHRITSYQVTGLAHHQLRIGTGKNRNTHQMPDLRPEPNPCRSPAATGFR